MASISSASPPPFHNRRKYRNSPCRNRSLPHEPWRNTASPTDRAPAPNGLRGFSRQPKQFLLGRGKLLALTNFLLNGLSIRRKIRAAKANTPRNRQRCQIFYPAPHSSQLTNVDLAHQCNCRRNGECQGCEAPQNVRPSLRISAQTPVP